VRLLPLLALSLVLLLAPAARAADCRGPVLEVADGDTLVVSCEGRPLRVRLDQIDAPEYRQPYGRRARKELAALVGGREVRLQQHGLDYYDRVLATVWLEELDVNRELLRRGYAWAYRRYLRDPALLEDEAGARAGRLGLWQDPAPQAPWDFRPPPRTRSAP
jgi:micrococcal nuclease